MAIRSPDEGYENTPKKKPIYRLLFLLRFVRRSRWGSRGKSSSKAVSFSARLSNGITLSF